MLAYMLSIMRAQQEYEEPAWSRYDEAFREKAASIGNRKWSQIDTHIYNQVFTGCAKALHYFSCYTHSCSDIDMHALFSVSCVCLLWLILLMSYLMNQVIYFGNIWEDDEMGR